jgi:xanthine dehydrogenase molybdopterin-binding subunit B
VTSTLDVADPQALFNEPEYRVEGPLKVTGAARYTADVSMPGMLWLAYTRSPRPHARIVTVDTTAARQVRCPHDSGGADTATCASAAACWTERHWLAIVCAWW